jgi:lysine 2,3-aminomutase
VRGTEHLRTPVEAGLKIMEGLRGHTSGLAVPTFVVDLPKGGGKVPLQPNYVLLHTEEELVLRNYQGRIFHYRNPKEPGLPRNGRKNGKGAGAVTLNGKSQAQSGGNGHEDRTVVRP